MPIKGAARVPSPFEVAAPSFKEFICGEAVELNAYQRDALRLLDGWKWRGDDGGPRPALIELPTGCGKTGVAVLAPYVLGVHSVLVVTPSVVLTRQLADAFGVPARPTPRRSEAAAGQSFLVKRHIVELDSIASYRVANAQVILQAADLQAALDAKLDAHLVICNAHKFDGDRTGVDLAKVTRDRFDLVIVDEAHHYPAITWRRIVEHFGRAAKVIFLTATSETANGYVLGPAGGFPTTIPRCYRRSHAEAVAAGLIRPTTFEEVHGDDPMKAVALAVLAKLADHDSSDVRTQHQALILTRTVVEAEELARILNAELPNSAEAFVATTHDSVLERFIRGRLRVLTVCGRLLEGFDHPAISVVGIYRAVQSRVLFTQFVGRSVRKAALDDKLEAVVVSHSLFHQRLNYDFVAGSKIATEDPEEEPAEVTAVATLDDFVSRIGDVTAAQLAVGRAWHHLWLNEDQGPFIYLARHPEGGPVLWAAARGALKGGWAGSELHTATAWHVRDEGSCDNDDAQVGVGSALTVQLTQSNMLPQVNASAVDLRPATTPASKKAAGEVANALATEVPGLFARRRLLVAVLPGFEVAATSEPVVCLVVRGLGTPLDEEPLPKMVAGVPTRVVLGLPPRQCIELEPFSGGRVGGAGPPLHAPAQLEVAHDPYSPRSDSGTFGAFAHSKSGEVVGVTAGHVLMTRKERDDFDHGLLPPTFDELDVLHFFGGGAQRRRVGTRELNATALHPNGILDVGIIRDIPVEWLPVADELHVIPGVVFDEVRENRYQALDDAGAFPDSLGHTLGEERVSNVSYTGVHLVDTVNPTTDVLGQRVAKAGLKTGVTVGEIVAFGAAVSDGRSGPGLRWPYGPLEEEEKKGYGKLRTQQFAVERLAPVAGAVFCSGGDSGSLVWTETGGDTASIVGILHTMLEIDGKGALGVVTPGWLVEEVLEVRFCTARSHEAKRTLTAAY